MTTHHEIWKKQTHAKTAEPTREADDLLLAEQTKVNPQDVLHAIKTPDMASPKSVLMLQRTYGNRATARILAQTRTQPGSVATVQPARDGSYVIRREVVTKTQQELAPAGDVAYGWDYGYSVNFTPNRCVLKIKVKTNAAAHPDTGETPNDKELAKVQSAASSQFAKMWDNEFLLVETATQKKYSLRTEVEFVDTGEDLAVNVYKGTGRDDLSNWYTDSDDGVTWAHELGHQMGLLDEYEDPGAENRKDSSAAGVHTDNSIMGNYFDEGISQATVKLRHGEHIAKDISDATGRAFSATKPSKIEMFFRKLFS